MALKSGWDEESSTKTGSPPSVSLDSRKNSNFATVPENQRWQLYACHCLTNKTSRPLQFFPSTIFPQPSERFSQTNVLKPNNKKGTLIWHTNCSQKTYYQLLAIIEAINLEIAENSSTFRAAFQLVSFNQKIGKLAECYFTGKHKNENSWVFLILSKKHHQWLLKIVPNSLLNAIILIMA